MPLLLFVGVLGGVGVAPLPVAAHPNPGLVVVTTAVPGVTVAPDGLLTYTVQVKNYRRDAASNVRVYVPYDGTHLTIERVEFAPGGDDWVSELSAVHTLLTFPQVGGGTTRSATVYARVRPDTPPGTVLTTWVSYSWNDSRAARDPRSSNAVPVLVGAGDEHSPFVWGAIEPLDDNGTRGLSFFSDRFVPGEPVAAALVVPGVGPVTLDDVRGQADARGRVWLAYRPTGQPPGDYHLLVTGRYSDLQAQVPFTLAP